MRYWRRRRRSDDGLREGRGGGGRGVVATHRRRRVSREGGRGERCGRPTGIEAEAVETVTISISIVAAAGVVVMAGMIRKIGGGKAVVSRRRVVISV